MTGPKSLTNLEVFVDADALPEVEEGEFYQRDLVGLPVFVALERGPTWWPKTP